MLRSYLILILFFTCASACTYKKYEEPQKAETIECFTSDSISFKNHIAPILEFHCGSSDINCHKTGNPNFLNLDNYNDINTYLSNEINPGATFFHAIDWDKPDIIKPMPRKKSNPEELGTKLPDCHISSIKKWVNAGFKNN